MKKIIFISVVLLLAGCSDTPSDKEFSDGSVEIIPEDLVEINKLESSILGNGDEIFSTVKRAPKPILVKKTKKELKELGPMPVKNYPLKYPLLSAWNKDKHLILWYRAGKDYTFTVQDTHTAEILETTRACFSEEPSEEQNYCVENKYEELTLQYRLNSPLDITDFLFSKYLTPEIKIEVDQVDGIYQAVLQDARSDQYYKINLPYIQNVDNFQYMGIYRNPNVGGFFLFYTAENNPEPFVYFVGQDEVMQAESMLYNDIAMNLYDAKQYEKALPYFQLAVKTDRKYDQAYFNLACTHALLGQADESIIFLNKAILLDSKYKGKAVRDRDFRAIAHLPKFQALFQ